MKKPRTDILEIGKDVLNNEAAALALLAGSLGISFERAVEMIFESKGKIVLSGVGKSGIVARKIASTLTSTGSLSAFVHPVEAFHGDFGVLGEHDVVIVISNSGETKEAIDFAAYAKKLGNKIIAIMSSKDSTLGRLADVAIETLVTEESCKKCVTSFNLAPTASALAALAVGDAIASALMELKGFQPTQFARLHPGGSLGKPR